MIDYEKLKNAHELMLNARPINGSIYIATYQELSMIGEYKIFYNLNLESENGMIEELEYKNLDDLINKLTELSQPQPKYKEDQQMWYLNGHEVGTSLIEKVVKNDNSINYVINDGNTSLPECALFPTKLDLIKFQSNYWNKLLEESRITFVCPSRYTTGYMDPFDMPVTELTQPQTKYKVGDEVWFSDSENNIHECTVKSCCTITTRYVLTDDCEYRFIASENRLFPTKLELIQAQCDYWIDQRQNERGTMNAYLEDIRTPRQCPHETDGNCYTSNPPQYKCKLCGEFYK